MRATNVLVAVSILLAPAMSGCGKKAKATPPAQPPVASAPAAALPAPATVDATRPAALERVHFGFDRTDLDADARRILTAGAQVLREHPQLSVRIEGHADDQGSTQYNLALSEKRAAAVVAFLVDLGIEGRRLQTVAMGEERPVDASATGEARAKNRRAELRPVRRGLRPARELVQRLWATRSVGIGQSRRSSGRGGERAPPRPACALPNGRR